MNWSDRAIGVARALLVEDMAISKAAEEFHMTMQQAGVHRSRLLKIVQALDVKKISADDFMLQERPAQINHLEPFKNELAKLKRNKYSMEQILDYLAKNGVSAKEQEVVNFLKGS